LEGGGGKASREQHNWEKFQGREGEYQTSICLGYNQGVSDIERPPTSKDPDVWKPNGSEEQFDKGFKGLEKRGRATSSLGVFPGR